MRLLSIVFLCKYVNTYYGWRLWELRGRKTESGYLKNFFAFYQKTPLKISAHCVFLVSVILVTGRTKRIGGSSMDST